MKDTVVLLTNDGMGQAEQALRHKLIRTYLTLLLENNQLPEVFCLYTEGVRLVVSGSPVLDLFKQIEEKGTRIILCSTCLNYLDLTNAVQVGIVGGMADIIEAQARAGKVITL